VKQRPRYCAETGGRGGSTVANGGPYRAGDGGDTAGS
jgi:hypothetical protein